MSLSCVPNQDTFHYNHSLGLALTTFIQYILKRINKATSNRSKCYVHVRFTQIVVNVPVLSINIQPSFNATVPTS